MVKAILITLAGVLFSIYLVYITIVILIKVIKNTDDITIKILGPVFCMILIMIASFILLSLFMTWKYSL